MKKYLSHPPMRPFHKPVSWPKPTARARFVDAVKGSDANSGAESAPYKTIAHALTQAQAGETIVLRGGVFHENVYLAAVGRPDAPITIRSYPNEIATIDGGGCPEFIGSPRDSWEPVGGAVPHYFRSARPYKNKRYAFGRFADSMVGLLTYQHREDIEEPHRTEYENHAGEPFPMPLYIGPGLWYDAADGRIYCRLSRTNYRFTTPGAANYEGVTDPREIPIVISFYGSLPLFMDGAQHVILQDIEIRGAGEDAIRMRGCHNVTFDNVTVHCGTYGIHARSSGPVKFLNSALYGSVPPWHVHAGQGLRVYSLKDKLPNGKPPTRDIARLNTHVVLAIEGRTEEQVDYYIPGQHDWEIAYSDFTDSLDGIHLGGNGVRFHHNRLDRFQDDALYLTPLTPSYMSDVQVYCNLFTRCMFSFGFGGKSEPAVGPVYIYRNIVDQRAEFLWTHYRPTSNVMFCTHFQGIPKLGEIHFYQNTVLTRVCPRAGRAGMGDWDRTYAMTTLIHTEPGPPRRVFNNIFVHLEGMIPPSADSLPSPNDDVQVDGNVHLDLVQPERSKAKWEKFRQSEVAARTGWESHGTVGDPMFERFADDNQWARNDYRIGKSGAARHAGVPLPAEYPDPLRPSDGAGPDAGALPFDAPPLRAGRALTSEDQEIYSWLERNEILGGSASRPTGRAGARPSKAQPAPLADLPATVEALREHGWCALHEIIPAQTAWLTRRTLGGIAVSCGLIAQSLNANLPTIPFYTRVSVIKDTQLFAPFLVDERILKVVRGILGNDICVTATTMVVHDPGTPRGAWHAGEPFDMTSTTAPDHLTLFWMFSPFTQENGGYLIVPGSHRRGAPNGDDALPQPGEGCVTGRSGDVVITDGRLWRAIAYNDGDAPRLSVTVGYARASGNPKQWPRDEKSILSERTFGRLPANVQPLFQHWVQR